MDGAMLRNQQWTIIVTAAFPFTTNFAQAVSAHLKLFAELVEKIAGGAMFVPFNLSRDRIRAFALFAVIEKPVSRLMGANTTECFGIHAGPEQRDVADVSVHVPFGETDSLLGFTKHLEDFRRGSAIGTTDLVDSIQANKTEQHVADIINQLDIRHTKLGMKDVLV